MHVIGAISRLRSSTALLVLCPCLYNDYGMVRNFRHGCTTSDHESNTTSSYDYVPAGSPSRGGDVKVCVLDINQPSLPTHFTLFLCLYPSYGPFTCISFHKSSRPPRSGELRKQKLKSHLVRTQLKRSPFKAQSSSVYSHTCYAYCQGFLPCLLFLPFQSIHLYFFSKTSPDFACVGCG